MVAEKKQVRKRTNEVIIIDIIKLVIVNEYFCKVKLNDNVEQKIEVS